MQDEDILDADADGASAVHHQPTENDSEISPERPAGLQAQVIQGECALCGSGNEIEPLGWVVRLTL